MTAPVSVPEVLIPNVPDLTRWAVIACDQFTAEPEYWEAVTKLVGAAPSSLNFVLPEVWLAEQLPQAPERIAEAMEHALAQGMFDERRGYVLVERTLPPIEGPPIDGAPEGGARGEGRGPLRRLGLIANIDLGQYEYTDDAEAAIRATERTVADRLPPRVAVRSAAPLDLPHALVLLDDAEQRVIEACYERRGELELLYDFALNAGGGHLRGWLLPDDDGAITRQLAGLRRDGLFAVVGDGNHSIAAAKLAGDTQALVELTNIHGEAIEFEPIHRVVFGAGPDLVPELVAHLRGKLGRDAGQTTIYHDGEATAAPIAANPADAIADIQQFLDDYAALHPGVEIDYIHGDDNLRAVADRASAAGQDAVAIFLPAIDKASLFDYVVRRGVLPRKAFSIGHARDKRYYLELARRR